MTREAEQAFDELSVPEQILLVQDLWDRIATNPDAFDPMEAQRRVFERRLRAYEEDPAVCESWEDLRQRLKAHSAVRVR